MPLGISLCTLESALKHGNRDRLLEDAHDPRMFRRDAYLSARADRYIARAKSYVGTPMPELRYSDYKLFNLTGNRDKFESPYFQRRRRLADLAISLMADGDEDGALAAALEDTIWAICDEYSWALPAHLPEGGNTAWPHDGLSAYETARTRTHRNTIDLFASETGFALAETMAMVGEKLSAVVTDRAHKEINDRILSSFSGFFPQPHWETVVNNWAAVCGGSVGATFLYEITDHMLLSSAMLHVLGAMESFLASFNDDGACLEGMSYWNYGFGFYVYFAELLFDFTAGEIDLMQQPKVKQIAEFQQKAYLCGDKVVSFSDGGLTSRYAPGLTHHLKSLFPSVMCPPIEYAMTDDDGCARFALAVRNFVWYDPQCTGEGLLSEDSYLPKAEWLISRTADEKHTFACAVKFGHNDEPHNHNDIGTFLLNFDGDAGPTDIGCGEYTRQFFSSQRYGFLCASSRGHSVPIINGKYQSAGRNFAAKDVLYDESGSIITYSADIAGAYDEVTLTSLVRRFTLDKAAYTLALEDSYAFSTDVVQATERFIGFDEPYKLAEGRWRFGALIAELDPSIDVTVNRHEFMSHGKSPKPLYVYSLDAQLPNASAGFKIVFRAEISRTDI